MGDMGDLAWFAAAIAGFSAFAVMVWGDGR